MTRTLYEKRGRRYVPVAERDTFDAVPLGWWLVHVQPGLRSSRPVDPAHAEVEAVMRIAEGAMVEAMRTKNVARSLDVRHYPNKARAEKAWRAWVDIMGPNTWLHFEGVSMRDVVDAGLAELRKQMGVT